MEYPWFAAWDLALHTITLAHLDPAFAKYQLILLCREWFQKPNGALPAYEWDFGDVNPPVQAWAALEVFAIDGGTWRAGPGFRGPGRIASSSAIGNAARSGRSGVRVTIEGCAARRYEAIWSPIDELAALRVARVPELAPCQRLEAGPLARPALLMAALKPARHAAASQDAHGPTSFSIGAQYSRSTAS